MKKILNVCQKIWKKLFQRKNDVDLNKVILLNLVKFKHMPVKVGLNSKGKFTCEYIPVDGVSDLQVKTEVNRIIKNEIQSMEKDLEIDLTGKG